MEPNEVQVVLGKMLLNGNTPRSNAGELRDNHFVSATGGTFCWCELCRFTRQCMIIYDSACKCTEKKYRKALIFSCFFLTNINRHVHIYIFIHLVLSVLFVSTFLGVNVDHTNHVHTLEAYYSTAVTRYFTAVNWKLRVFKLPFQVGWWCKGPIEALRDVERFSKFV